MVPGPSIDPFLKLAERLGELQRSGDDRARKAIGRAEDGLCEALAKRDSGDLTGAVARISQAMQALAASGGELSSAESATVHQVARALMESLDSISSNG